MEFGFSKFLHSSQVHPTLDDKASLLFEKKKRLELRIEGLLRLPLWEAFNVKCVNSIHDV